jgi:hypothetical protein
MQNTNMAGAAGHDRAAGSSPQRHNIAGAGVAHMLHDGFTDQLHASSLRPDIW